MRDEDKLKERIELLLDNRQIFLLFFASSVILVLVFSLGVVVGKRLDARSASAPPPSDPLTLLDQVSGQEPAEESLTFHEALTGEQGQQVTSPAEAGAKTAGAGQGAATGTDPAGEPAKEEAGTRGAGEPQKSEQVGAARAGDGPAADRPAARIAARAGGAKKTVETVARKDEEPAEASQAAGEGGGSEDYTLQLSSFQERHEAEQFMQKLREVGMSPYLIPTTIPGRGIWFRVRMGAYGSWEEALSAKQVFERQHKVIAYVTKK